MNKTCSECGAECGATARTCWICQASLPAEETVVTAEVVPEPRPGGRNPVTETLFAFSTILLVGVALLVGIGIAFDEPGAAIVYAMVASPAVIATVVRLQLRKAQVGSVSWAERFATLVVSTALTISVLTLVGIACLVGFFLYCLIAISSDGFRVFH